MCYILKQHLISIMVSFVIKTPFKMYYDVLLYLNLKCFTGIQWKTINIINNSTIILYDVGYNALIRPLTCKMLFTGILYILKITL